MSKYLQKWCLPALIATALATSIILPKDHTAYPLGEGCYWSYTGLPIGSIQREHCDQWRKNAPS